MKLIDPFAGFQMFMGSAELHLAYFVMGIVTRNNDADPDYNIKYVSNALIVVHILAFLMIVFTSNFAIDFIQWTICRIYNRDNFELVLKLRGMISRLISVVYTVLIIFVMTHYVQKFMLNSLIEEKSDDFNSVKV